MSVVDTADKMANRILDSKINPEIRTIVTIFDTNGENADRGYDIESVDPGEVMKIRNIEQGVKAPSLWDQMQWDVDVWDQTLTYTAAEEVQILSIAYKPQGITIEASSRLPEISKRIEDINRNLVASQTKDNPASPTA